MSEFLKVFQGHTQLQVGTFRILRDLFKLEP